MEEGVWDTGDFSYQMLSLGRRDEVTASVSTQPDGKTRGHFFPLVGHTSPTVAVQGVFT